MMSRPLRLQFAGALYHVTSRGNERQTIYRDEDDFARFLAVLTSVCERFNWVIHSYCLMINHYHLLVETPDANLAKGMRQLRNQRGQVLHRAFLERLTIVS
ncbi:transposase [Pseudoalteromonas xiamenensis]|uniref:transposase n=1 Tax=Pseudoalteromonas xiamenensis TaxID=882626 RepID=UPI0027E3B852|nr:transposase [Pseudoalteromonas xiamenensis]WMN60894.1 transposase [Pseudoalteromonas xiamenensis]